MWLHVDYWGCDKGCVKTLSKVGMLPYKTEDNKCIAHIKRCIPNLKVKHFQK